MRVPVPTPGRDPASLYLARLSAGSRPTMRSALRTLVRLAGGGDTEATMFPWWTLRYADTQFIRSQLVEAFAPATARRHVACLRGVLKEAWRAQLIDSDAYARAVDMPAIRGSRLPHGRAPTPDELGALFRVCHADDGPIGARDAAMLALLAGGGLRREEVVGLDLVHLDEGVLRVVGKGDKERLVDLPSWAQRTLDRWIAIRGPSPGPLLLPVACGGRIGERRLSAHAVYMSIRKLVQRANIEKLAPHDMRRGWVSGLLEKDVDLATVQMLAGHSNPMTTAGYDRRPAAARRAATSRLPAPEF